MEATQDRRIDPPQFGDGVE